MLHTKNLVKTYVNGTLETKVLRDINLSVEAGEFVAIMGRSGAGKSTLLYQLSLLDNPTSGSVSINGINTERMSAEEKSNIRLNTFGYVFQDSALMPDLTALENVALPLLMQGKSRAAAEATARAVLDDFGLLARVHSVPSQLSGGEQQRVAIARAVAHAPSVLFADEPTANLDTISSAVVMDIFDNLHARGQTIIMVTHELEYAQRAKRLITLEDGEIVSNK